MEWVFLSRCGNHYVLDLEREGAWSGGQRLRGRRKGDASGDDSQDYS
jgi:hypothetical protein